MKIEVWFVSFPQKIFLKNTALSEEWSEKMEDVSIFKNAKQCCTDKMFYSIFQALRLHVMELTEYCVSFGDSFTVFMHLYFAKESKVSTTIKKYFFS